MNVRLSHWIHVFSARPLRIFILFWLLLALLYLPAWKGGFTLDFVGWLEMYRDNDLKGILNRNGTEIHSLYYITQLQLFCWTWLFGIHPLPWFLLFTGLQALNGTLLFCFCSRLFLAFRLPAAVPVALLGALLFLMSPNMTEVVVWKASYHYLTGVLLILWILLLCQSFLKTGRKWYAVIAAILFLISTFTLEIFYTTPWLLFCFLLASYGSGAINRQRWAQGIRWFFLPQLLLFGMHLLLYHAIYGKWIAHSAYESSGKVSFSILASRILHYEFHLLFFGRFFPNGFRNWVYHAFAEHPVVYLSLLFLMLGSGIYALLRFRKFGPRFQVLTLMIACSLITLAIILHFEVYEILLVINDRYLYLSSLFQCMLVAVLIGSLYQHRKTCTALSVLFLAGYGLLSMNLILKWRQATRVYYELQYHFRWKDAPAVLLLNLPCTYQGIGLINAGAVDGFNPHLRLFTRDTARGRIYDVSSYNMQQPWDGAHVTVVDSMQLKVTLNQWGSWWWWGTYGATDYENDLYRVQFTDPGHEYLLTLKRKIPGMVVLFQQGTQWRELDWSKPGVEQR